MTYGRLNRSTYAEQPGTTALRKAAKEAGLTCFAVPLCGGGFTNHHRNTATGRCIECRRAAHKRKSAEKSAAHKALKQTT